jgi:hypothetical protein
MSTDRSTVAARVLDEEFRLASIAFARARTARKLGGDFMGPFWRRDTRRLVFRRVNSSEMLDPVADKLARCFMVGAVTYGNEGGESLASKLTSFRYLADVVRKEKIEWHQITGKHLNKVVKLLAKRRKAPSITGQLHYLASLNTSIG